MKKRNHSRDDDFVPEREPMSAEVKEALDVVEMIEETISDKVADRAKRDNAEYFESVEERAKSIGKTIEKSNKVSDKQLTALTNMLAGVRKWVHEDDDD